MLSHGYEEEKKDPASSFDETGSFHFLFHFIRQLQLLVFYC
jgi:hypothetical protein